MKILITGGSGFVGSHLADRLIEKGDEVVVLDHWKSDKLRFHRKEICLYKKHFADKDALDHILTTEKPDAIVHLAAQISVTRSITDPIGDAHTNIVSSLHLLEAARKYGCGQILFASSGGAIYGDHPQRPTPELKDAKPISPYGIGKQAFEHYLDVFSKDGSLSSGVLRFSNIYGPRQLPKGEASVIAIFLDRLFKGEETHIFGDGSSTRDYVFVQDAVDAFCAGLEKKFNGCVNISTGVEASVLDVWTILRDLHDARHPHRHEPYRTGEVYRSVLDPKKAHGLLDWKARTNLQDGLSQTYDWFKQTFYPNF